MELIRCNLCGQQVSTPVPKTTQLRAWLLCYKCAESDTYIKTIVGLVEAIRFAAINADWCDPGLADAIHNAEKYVPKRLLR